MSFGWSAGDIFAAFRVIHQLIDSFKDASKYCQQLLDELSSLTSALNHVQVAMETESLDPWVLSVYLVQRKESMCTRQILLGDGKRQKATDQDLAEMKTSKNNQVEIDIEEYVRARLEELEDSGSLLPTGQKEGQPKDEIRQTPISSPPFPLQTRTRFLWVRLVVSGLLETYQRESNAIHPTILKSRQGPNLYEITTTSKQTRRRAYAILDTGNMQGNLVSRKVLEALRLTTKSCAQTSVCDAQCPTWTETTYDTTRLSDQRELGVQEFYKTYERVWMTKMGYLSHHPCASFKTMRFLVLESEPMIDTIIGRPPIPRSARSRRYDIWTLGCVPLDYITLLHEDCGSRARDKSSLGSEGFPSWVPEWGCGKPSMTCSNGTTSCVYYQDANEHLREFGLDDYRVGLLQDTIETFVVWSYDDVPNSNPSPYKYPGKSSLAARQKLLLWDTASGGGNTEQDGTTGPTIIRERNAGSLRLIFWLVTRLAEDSLERRWKTNGEPRSYKCSSYAIVNMKETGQQLIKFFEDNIRILIKYFISESDELLRSTYDMAFEYSKKAEASTSKRHLSNKLIKVNEQRDKERRLLKSALRIKANRERSWFTIYLCMFVLLHSCALLITFENMQVKKYGLHRLDKAQSILAQYSMMLGAALVWIGWFGFNSGSAFVAILKAVLHCLGDPVCTIWGLLERRASRSRIHAGQAMFLSMLLLPSFAVASPAKVDAEPSRGTKHCSSLLTALQKELAFVSILWATPQTLPRTFRPQILLLATLLSTTFTVLFYTLIRSNRFTKYFLSIGLVASALGGAIFAVDAPDFVFRYLFVGINVSLLVSVFEHRFQRKGRSEQTGLERDVEGNGVFEKEKDQMCG